MKKTLFCLILIYLSILILCSCRKNKSTSASCNIRYSTDIQPIIANKCAIPGCHADGSSLPNLNNYTVLKTWVDNGRVRANIFDLKIMPPANAAPLTEQEKEKLKCWLDDGAQQN